MIRIFKFKLVNVSKREKWKIKILRCSIRIHMYVCMYVIIRSVFSMSSQSVFNVV